MATQKQFEDLLRDIEPSATTKSNASSSHTLLRQRLREHDDFSPFHVDTFLSGSYKRDTAIRPQTINGQETRPDVDIIVVTNHTLYDSPPDVIDLLYDALTDSYATVRRQNRSVNVETSLTDMDVVPIIAPNGMDGTLYIPDRSLSTWIETNPPGQTVWTTEVNQASNGRFKPLVKLLKWSRRCNPTGCRRPKGFVIECIAAECMSYSETSYEQLVICTLDSILSTYRSYVDLGLVPRITDPGVAGNSVTDGMTFTEFQRFYNKVKSHADLLKAAKESGDPEKELAAWKAVFGPRFPAAASQNSATLLRQAVAPASVTFPDRPVRPNAPKGFA